jgi:signal transduction histidine kinase
MVDRIFDPFFTTKPKGIGLGLSIAYQIINKHGGTIKVESQWERGTSFVITLPENLENV